MKLIERIKAWWRARRQCRHWPSVFAEPLQYNERGGVVLVETICEKCGKRGRARAWPWGDDGFVWHPSRVEWEWRIVDDDGWVDAFAQHIEATCGPTATTGSKPPPRP